MTTPKPERMTDADLAACAERIGLAADHGEAASPDDAHALADEAIRANSGEEQAVRESDDARARAQHLLNGKKAALRARVAELEAKLARLASNSVLGPIPFMLDDSPQSAELRLRMEFAEQALKPAASPEQASTLQDPTP